MSFQWFLGSFFLNRALLQEYLGKWISDSLWPKNVRINEQKIALQKLPRVNG